MDFTDVSHGFDANGLESYVQYLKATVLEPLEAEMGDYSELYAALEQGWQGVSLDKFKDKFENTLVETDLEIRAEFGNLIQNLYGLGDSYMAQDRDMMEE